jgi:tetratricopeptide (TPR) repeat protein
MKIGWRSPFRQKIGCVLTGFVFCAIGFLCDEVQAAAQAHTGLPHAERARTLMQSQNYAAAIEEWGNLAGAAQIFRKTFNETGAPEFQVAYALALEKQGNGGEALKDMEKAAALLPNDARTRFEYRKLLSENGRMNDARRELERAKALDPKLSENLYFLSRLYQKLGETDRAARTMKEFLVSKEKSRASPQ